MSDSNQNDPGRFGEDGAAVIQVTPGQLVGAAFFLMVGAAIIFFAGMFARSLTMDTTTVQSDPAPEVSDELDQVAVLPAPDPIDPKPEPEPIPTPAEPVEDPTPVEPEPEPTPEIVEETTPVVESGPATVEEVEPEPVMETQPPEPEPTPEPEPEPSKPPPPPAQPKPQPLPEIPASTTGPYTVQVMSIGITKRAKAEVFQRDALENKNVLMELVESSDGKLLRAYVGSYANRSEAETARDELARAGFEGCFIKKREE